MEDITDGPIDDPETFGRRLHHARKDSGISQSRLAEGICSASAISRWEAGHSTPTPQVIDQLAKKLNLDVSVLTGWGFTPRLAESPQGFAAILQTLFGGESTDQSSSIAHWIREVNEILRCVDPWLGVESPRQAIDELALSPLTSYTPVAAEMVEILEALADIKETRTMSGIDRVVHTLAWAKEIPIELRLTAVEIAVSVLVMEGMPVAAREVVVNSGAEEITPTTAVLLCWDDDSFTALPPRCTPRGPRDVALSLLWELREVDKIALVPLADALMVPCGQDSLVKEFVHRLL